MKQTLQREPLYDGARIERRMKERDLSDGKVAAGTGISRPTVINIRRGLNTEVESVLAVLAFLELDPGEVFFRRQTH